jgi:large subunit ribosomal protein L15
VKLHDLRPAPGSHKARRRVGRGIASGQGKTAGRGTKGQKARAGGSIPAWFEGGQTPLHQRIPKLHGFRNPFRIEYEVVNIGAIAHLLELGALEAGEMPGAAPKRARSSPAPVTVNQEILRAAGVVRTLNKPMKILGAGELSTALFVVADAFSGSARAKIEAAGGTVSVLEVPKERKAAVGVKREAGSAESADSGTAPAPEAGAVEAEPIEAGPAKSKSKSKSTSKSKSESAEPAEPAEPAAAPAASAEAESAGDAELVGAGAADVPADEAAAPAAEAAAPAAAKPKARAPRKPKAAAPDAEA